MDGAALNTMGLVADEDGNPIMQLRDQYAPTSQGLWTIPGGIAAPGESAAESAHREWTEETGVRTKLRFFGRFVNRSTLDLTPTVRSIWAATVAPDTEVSTREGQYIGFMRRHELNRLEVTHTAKIVLASAYADYLPPLREDYRGVVFDFGKTLTLAPTARALGIRHKAVAKELGLTVEDYDQAFRALVYRWGTGELGSEIDALRAISMACGIDPAPKHLSRAARVWREWEVEHRTIRPGAVDVLAELAFRGIKVGLVSDTLHALPGDWSSLPVAPYITHPVFSVLCGARKPDAAPYLLAASHLDVPPERILYVGDGGSTELPGASALGMGALRLRADDHWDEDSMPWPGPQISDLAEVLNYVA